MTTDAHIDFKDKIMSLENSGGFLEAFLIQSAYVESLLRRLFNYQLSLHISNVGIRRAIKSKNQHLSTVLKFCADSGWLLKDESERAKKYFEERNSIIHDLVASNSIDLDGRLKKLLVQGKLIIEDHGSLERFMGIAQLEYSRGEMVPTRESLDLSEKEKKVLGLRFSDKTLEEIGKEFGITRERVRQIQNKAIQKMEGLVSASVLTVETIAKLKIEKSNARVIKKVAVAKQRVEALRLADIFIQDVCQKKNIEMWELQGESRKADLVLIRHWIAYSLRENFKLSYPAIGKKLNRDHTTIIHAHNRIATLVKEGSSSSL